MLIPRLSPALPLSLVLVLIGGASAQVVPSDDAVALVVENELLSSPVLTGQEVEVDVADGVATLSGQVDSLLAKTRAVERAGRVRGVKAVVNQIVVTPRNRADAEIDQDVKIALRRDAAVEGAEIQSSVELGKVILEGEVDSYGEKVLAGEIASGARGVVELDNRLSVAATESRPDQEIQADVAGLIEMAAGLDDAEITVAVTNGAAVLNGVVATAWQKELALAKAWLAGATAVDGRGLRVDWERADGTRRRRRFTAISDAKIREAMERAFRLDPRLVGQQPAVSVQRGQVMLRGQVSTLRAKDAAAEIAADTTGVVGVRNRLRVRSADEPASDPQIERHVIEALARDPNVEEDNVVVEVRNAHVQLYGLVDSEFEKFRAARTAGGQAGVVHVANNLSVLEEWVPKSDDAIQEDLQQKIAWTLCCGGAEIEVNVEDGVAMLIGEVDTWRQWQAAMDLAIEAGARRPHNLLMVRYRPRSGAGGAYVPE